MISTRYFENRTQDVLESLKSDKSVAAGHRPEGDVSALTLLVVNRWMQSVYLC